MGNSWCHIIIDTLVDKGIFEVNGLLILKKRFCDNKRNISFGVYVLYER
jgi:hypothetical protein